MIQLEIYTVVKHDGLYFWQKLDCKEQNNAYEITRVGVYLLT